jgi:Ca2+/Na+ antiporter
MIFPLLHYTVMIGLTIVISSREEKEDEMIRMVRLKSFQYGLYFTVFVSLVLFVLSIAGNHDLRLSQLVGIGGINATLIYIVVIYQFKLFNLKNDEE